MARLTNPAVGTVVSVEGDLEETYRAAGWVDADDDVSAQQDEATPEKPKRGRPRKSK